MSIEVAVASKEFKDNLNIENWFENLGNILNLNDKNLFHPFNIEFIEERIQINKLMKADSWVNVDLEAFNIMLSFVDQDPTIVNKNIINDLAVEGYNILKASQAEINKKIINNKLKKEVFNFVITPIIIRAFQEFYLSKYSNSMHLDFASNLLKILKDGYLPCGWKSLKMRVRNDYNPITYIEDSFIESSKGKMQPFDYASGVLYLF